MKIELTASNGQSYTFTDKEPIENIKIAIEDDGEKLVYWFKRATRPKFDGRPRGWYTNNQPPVMN